MTDAYRLVRLANGTTSIHDTASEETFHPVVGPVAEARTLYVDQLRLRERMSAHHGAFVLWDIGLGAAANALTALRETRDIPCDVTVESFDRTTAALAFALENRDAMGYVDGYEGVIEQLLNHQHSDSQDKNRRVIWRVHRGEIPAILNAWTLMRASGSLNDHTTHPDAILFDPCSLIRNPEMWTLSLFENLFACLDPRRPCSLATYSRSTMIRVTLLLAGFWTGVGRGVGEKEETTVAANSMSLIEQPLDLKWLERAFKSGAAEPMREAIYRQAPLSAAMRERLRAHPQFQ